MIPIPLALRRLASCLLFPIVLAAANAAPAQSVRMVLDLSGQGGFYDTAFPTDLRRGPGGELDLSGFPNPLGLQLNALMQQVVEEDVSGWGVNMPLYVRFDGPLANDRLPDFPTAYASRFSPVQLVDVDAASPERGRRFPLLVDFEAQGDSYRASHLLQALPVQGIDLRPNTSYALVVMDDAPTPPGWWLEADVGLTMLLNGIHPGGALGAQAVVAYAPLADQLALEGVDPQRVVAATVFTTGDPTETMQRLGRNLSTWAAPQPLGPLSVLHDFPEYYVLQGEWEVPLFQSGLAPYLGAPNGAFQYDAFGAPVQQGTRRAKFVVTVPKGTMEVDGFPLLFYVHGTGGLHTQVFDRGEIDAQGVKDLDGGPSEVAAQRGWGSCSMAGHLAPEHMGPLSFGGYILYNLFNPRAMRDNQLQLVAENLLFRRLVLDLQIDPALCPQTNASASTTGKIHFDASMNAVMGQSLGSYVSGMLAAVDPMDWQGVILTGSGGSWIEFARGPEDPFSLQEMIENVVFLFPPGEKLDVWHPLFTEVEMALGPANNLHHLESLLKYPRPGRIAPHVLTIQGSYDSQVPDGLQRAQALAVTADFVGDEVGPYPVGQILPFLLAAGGRQLQPPVEGNRPIPGQGFRSAALVRYLEDGISGDGHHVAFQREEPKHQYGCFLETLAGGGPPRIVAGTLQGAPCQ